MDYTERESGEYRNTQITSTYPGWDLEYFFSFRSSPYIYEHQYRECDIAQYEFSEMFPVFIFPQMVSTWYQYLYIEKCIEKKCSIESIYDRYMKSMKSIL